MLAIKRAPNRLRSTIFSTLLGVAIAMPAASSNNPSSETEELIDLSLEELLQVEVTTLSRKPQTLTSSAAAVFVVTQADIQQSGARTLPDILRMVPGLQVAQVDASTWAVAARGSNGVFAGKLLVLQDGRSVYGPMYSGVRWDAQDTDISSIERIEVVRGPGAVMWGSNAVNGVINIITKNAADTQGFEADVAVGSYTNLETTVRWGGSAGKNANYRFFAKYFDREGFADSNYDAWDYSRLGGRLDWAVTESDDLRVNAEIYAGTVGENYAFNSLTPPYQDVRDVETNPSGGFVTTNWTHTLSDTSDMSVQVYYDRADRTSLEPNEERDTSSLDFQHRFKLGGRNDVVWGFEVRHSEDQTAGNETISLDPPSRTQRLYSGFMQDEIRLFRDEVFLTLGTKVEKNNFSQSNHEWSPSARLSWLFSDTGTAWTSVSRAVRTPNRIEQDVRILGGVIPPGVPPNTFPVPYAVQVYGNPEFDSERVTAYEVGFRTQVFQDMTIDVAVFYNDYEDLRYGEVLGLTCQPAGLPISDPACFMGPLDAVEMGVTFINRGQQDTRGLELAASYLPTDWWRLHAAYTYLDLEDNDNNLPLSFGEDAPRHQVSLRSDMNVTASGNLDLWFRYVDDLPVQDVPSYFTLDARLAWRFTRNFEAALIGRNLLESSHLEFREEFGANTSVEIQREALAELALQF
jgi:iron complex outermembrane receptor protein